MGSIFKPDKPKIPDPPPLPDLDAERLKSRETAISEFRRRRGRRSTILSGGEGDTTIPVLNKTLLGS